MNIVRTIGALVFATLLLSLGCKKDEDEKEPIPVTILSPSEGATIWVLQDTIRVMANVKLPDDGPASIHIYLKDEVTGTLVVPPLLNYVTNTRNTVEFNYTVSDSLLSSGTYKLEVKAITNDNSGSSTVSVNLVAVPRRRIGTLLLTRPDSTRTRLWLADATLNLSLFREMSGDYLGSALQNQTGTFLIARRTTAATFFKISDGTVLRTVNGEQPAPTPSFSAAGFQQGTHFLSFYQSSIRGYDSNGNEMFRTASQPLDYDFRQFLRDDNYLFAYAHLDLPSTDKLFVINYPSGASRAECSLNMRVSGILPADGNDVYLVGTRNDGAISVMRYFFTTNTANELVSINGPVLLDVVPGPQGVGARVLTDQGIYRFEPPGLTLQRESTRTGDRLIRDEYEPRLYLVDSLQVSLLNDFDLTEMATLTSPEPVKNVIDWYNR